MKRTFTKLLAALALLVFMTPSLAGWGQTTGTLTLSSTKKFGTTSGSTLDDNQDNTWTCDGINIQNSYNSSYTGQQFGTSKTNDTYTFTADFSDYTVTYVAITAAAGNSIPTYDISVGGSSWKSGSLSTTSTSYSESGSGTGNVIITLNQNSSKKAVYLGSITVTYTSSGPAPTTHSLTFSANPAAGGTVKVNNSTTSPATVAENASANISATANDGYVFSGWEKTSGEGSFGNASSASTTFTMGTTDATIRANFTELQTYTITYHANVTGIDNQTVNVDQGANHAVKPANTFDNDGYGFTQWTTEQDGSGTAYYQGVTITDIQDDIDLWAQWEEVNYDFRNIDGFDSWSSQYGSHTVEYSNDATVTFSSACKQGNTITDQPVTKGNEVTLVLANNATMSSAKFYFTQWTNKTQTITLSYSTDGGTTYSGTTPATTSTNFVISNANLPTGTNAVKITFSSTSNQIGIAGAKITKIASTNPSLAAEDVDLEYDDEDGSISYTLNNPQTGGAVTAAITAGNTGNWLSIGDPSNSNASGTVALTCGVNPGAQRTATVTLTYTYNSNVTIEEEVTVTQAVNPNYVPTITEVRAQGTGSVHTRGVVTSVNGKTAYIQDSGAAIAVYDSENNLAVAVGDQIDVTGTLGTYNGLLQIQSPTVFVLSNGNTVEPEVMTIAQVNASTKQGWLVKIEEATVSAINSQNVTIAQSSNSVVVRFNSSSDITFEQNNVITLTGNIGYYNAVQIANPTDVTVQQLPAISVNPASLTGFTYVVDNGPSTTKTVSVSGANLTANISLSLGDNSDFEMSTTEGSGYTNSLTLTQSEGSVAATTVYVRLKSSLAVGDSYSGTITLTSAGASDASVSLSGSVTEPVVDYATLPFAFTEGKAAIENTNGLTQSGLGNDLSSAPVLKFDGADDYVILKTGSAPGSIVFDIKGTGSGTWSGTFKVQLSSDGTVYSDMATYTSLTGNVQTEIFTNIDESVRYIKWVFVAKTSGFNVGLGNIYVKEEAIQTTTWTAGTFTPEANHVYVVNSGATLVLDGDYSETLNNADNFIIEDGGQLITHYAVAATVKKEVAAATNWGTETTYTPDGWYFIASPVNGAAFPTGTVANQDIYQLDWANNTWLNLQKDTHSSLLTGGFQRGTGYLYASKDGNTVSVAGEIKHLTAADTAQVVLKTNGWNLIGNPLTCKVTVDKAFSELTNASAVTNQIASSAINPCQGIAVWGYANDEVTFTKAATQNAAAPSNNSSLQMTLSQNIVTRGNTTSTTVDNAVVSFKEGNVLPKFSMLEGNAKLYIPQGTEEYAIVSTAVQGEIPVNFVTAEDGEYTINVNPENVEMNYLHLIDNITGADVDLLINPSYTFNGSTNDYASRFRLVFSGNSVNEFEAENGDFAFISNGQIILNGVNENATLQMVDMTGRIVSTEQVNGNAIRMAPVANGVYVLRLINGNDVKTQKIVVR